MKMLQTLTLILLASCAVVAQNAEVKGPKAKNMKSKDRVEMNDTKVVTAEKTDLKGPERKNLKRNAATNQDTVGVTARPRTDKGPKAKNKKAWK